MMKTRSVVTYRGSVEGLQEILYCEHLQRLINENEKFPKRVNFKFENSRGGSPTTIVNKAKKNSLNKNNKNIAIYDRDFKDDFITNINLAKKHNIIPAYSNQKFNYFLILHKKYTYKQTTKEDGYINELKNTFHLPKTIDIKSEKGMNLILEQISLDEVENAMENIKKVNEKTKNIQEELAPNIYEQPFLNILEFLEDVFIEINKN